MCEHTATVSIVAATEGRENTGAATLIAYNMISSRIRIGIMTPLLARDRAGFSMLPNSTKISDVTVVHYRGVLFAQMVFSYRATP